MKINWLVRAKNKTFWLSLIPTVILLIQVIAVPFGYQIDLTELSNQLIAIVNALFAVLAVLGIVVDPTTEGIKDSEQALEYAEPKANLDAAIMDAYRQSVVDIEVDDVVNDSDIAMVTEMEKEAEAEDLKDVGDTDDTED